MVQEGLSGEGLASRLVSAAEPVYVLVEGRENMMRCAQISDQASGNERLAVAGEDLLERPEISLW